MTPGPRPVSVDDERRNGLGIVWFRRDLRLADNPALTQAVSAHDSIMAVFVWDPTLVRAAGAPRLRFLRECLEDLDRSLARQLVQRFGDPSTVVPALAAAAGAATVWCAEDFGPYGTRRDARVAAALGASGVELRRVSSPYAVSPGRLVTTTGAPYRVFTPFSRAWRAVGQERPLPRPRLDAKSLRSVPSDNLDDAATSEAALPPGGEAAAHRLLDRFLARQADHYDTQRDRPDLQGTSRLSAYLKFGCLHPRQILARLDPGSPGHQAFESELCWREFYADVLYHRPDSARTAYHEQWRSLEVDHGAQADRHFSAWCRGMTGYPIVDAGMRQLRQEAWMHNRVRMIVASFLVKDLHLDWRLGARWFMQHLVDGDLASNQLGWQWVAGTGTDAAPYFRIFNPLVQAARFDPEGDYVRRYVPELAELGNQRILEPWRKGGSLFDPVLDYPAPIVDHAAARAETLARYGAVRPRS